MNELIGKSAFREQPNPNQQTVSCDAFQMCKRQRASDSGGINGSPIAQSPFEEAIVATSLLTEREKQIVRLIAKGRSSEEIGASLNISVKTVEFHREAIMAKLGVKGTDELVRYAISAGLIDP
ncbi:MAG TPA: LuxR C-terminal-related transcriptional regulator [Bryobacteraceae bacterium]|nr:LuxR C-terminal-related transcriptional regulator [Bryobacteraceae bacterium]